MKNEDFENLMQGVKELKLYRQKKLKPSRVFNYDPDIKAIRLKLKMCNLNFQISWVSVPILLKIGNKVDQSQMELQGHY